MIRGVGVSEYAIVLLVIEVTKYVCTVLYACNLFQMIGKIINDNSGIIWWFKAPNHLQSVYVSNRHIFFFGANLAEKNLLDLFKEG